MFVLRKDNIRSCVMAIEMINNDIYVYVDYLCMFITYKLIIFISIKCGWLFGDGGKFVATSYF